jgi:hypothetical protein
MKSINKSAQLTKKKSWEAMKLSFLGKATALIKNGGGKLSIAGGDPGESRKSPNVGG